MVFPYPMDPYDGPIPYQWPALLSSPPALLWILNDGLPLPYGSYYGDTIPLWPMNPMTVFPYPMDHYNGPIPYQCPALLSSTPALLSYSFGLRPCWKIKSEYSSLPYTANISSRKNFVVFEVHRSSSKFLSRHRSAET